MSRLQIAAAAAKAPPREAKFTASGIPHRVLNPGDAGYHGSVRKPQNREDWAHRVNTGENPVRTKRDRARRDADEYASFNRKWGRIAGGTGLGFAAAGTAGGVLLNQQGKRKAAALRAKPLPQRRVAKGVKVNAADPLIRIARRRLNGTHDITSLPKHRRLAATGRAIRNGERRLSEAVGNSSDNMSLAIGGGYAAGMGALTLGASAGQDKINAARRQRRAAAKAQVGKSARPSLLREHFGTPGRAVRTLARNPEHLAAGGILGVGLGAQATPLERRRTPEQRHRADVGSAAVAGGALGQGAWLGTGYSIRHQGHKLERTRPEGMSRSQYQRIMRDHHRATGVPQNSKPDRAHAPAFYRNYPKELPAAKYKRALGHMSGRRGALLQAAVVGGGAYTGAAVVRGRRQEVGKALYQREERFSPVRVVGTAAGLGLTAWGAGRSRMIGTALGRGVKLAEASGNHRAVQALQLAQAAQGVLARSTAPGERALRQIQAVDHAVRAVPAPIRPEVAAAAGVLLTAHSQPMRREHYKPVSRPIPVRPVGW